MKYCLERPAEMLPLPQDSLAFFRSIRSLQAQLPLAYLAQQRIAQAPPTESSSTAQTTLAHLSTRLSFCLSPVNIRKKNKIRNIKSIV